MNCMPCQIGKKLNVILKFYLLIWRYTTTPSPIATAGWLKRWQCSYPVFWILGGSGDASFIFIYSLQSHHGTDWCFTPNQHQHSNNNNMNNNMIVWGQRETHTWVIFTDLHAVWIWERGERLLAGTFPELSAARRSKTCGDNNRRQTVTPYIRPCYVCLHCHTQTLDQVHIAQKPTS